MTNLLLLCFVISVLGYARIMYLTVTGRLTRWMNWEELDLLDLWIARITLVSMLGFIITLITALMLK